VASVTAPALVETPIRCCASLNSPCTPQLVVPVAAPGDPQPETVALPAYAGFSGNEKDDLDNGHDYKVRRGHRTPTATAVLACRLAHLCCHPRMQVSPRVLLSCSARWARTHPAGRLCLFTVQNSRCRKLKPYPKLICCMQVENATEESIIRQRNNGNAAEVASSSLSVPLLVRNIVYH